jgi:hypothetical protein
MYYGVEPRSHVMKAGKEGNYRIELTMIVSCK